MGKIILVRHGETELNTAGVFFGIMDPILTPEGMEQAESAKKILKELEYHKIYTSDLKRAKETAEIINYKKINLVLTKELREINFGIFEGYSYQQLLEKYPAEVKKSQEDWENYNYETGESVLQLQKRAIDFIEKELDLNKNTVLVTHWGVINTILSHYFSVGLNAYWKFSVKNGGIVIIEFSEGYPILKGLNIGG
ncbi:histidine phosphatase family protein [uncultured Cetobacterium sp.]|uniref:histidine phosphatase family protein n=1 Tax=uncultured Cetobacterium sp. TaxID=527638 RepID=UPI002601DCC4|nr:histidine phosphatase family protein [uncultured Cetobacterium sp.]